MHTVVAQSLVPFFFFVLSDLVKGSEFSLIMQLSTQPSRELLGIGWSELAQASALFYLLSFTVSKVPRLNLFFYDPEVQVGKSCSVED